MSDTPCKTCDNKAGLSILLTRPSALALDTKFAPNQAEKLLTHPAFAAQSAAFGLPALKKSRYVLRMLRQGGYVYVFYPQRPPQFVKPWQAFKVHDSGALIPEGAFFLGDEKAEFACSKKPAHPNDVRTLCIQLPEGAPDKAGPVWIGFSMNWWSDKFRATMEKAPGSAGMVCINPLKALGGVAHAFKADVTGIEQHVAEFALRLMDHGGVHSGINLTEGGVSSATPFYNKAQDKTYGQAKALADIMAQQAAVHPLTKGKEFVLVIPDPVGLALDLNDLRMARDQLDKKGLLPASVAWPLVSYGLLEGLRAGIEANAPLDAAANAYGSVTQRWWNEHKNTPYYSGSGHVWEATEGTDKKDGSPNGRITRPGDLALPGRLERQGRRAALFQWNQIISQIDQKKLNEWRTAYNKARKEEAEVLEIYEMDWLDAAHPERLKKYFGTHFDELDENHPDSLTCAGKVYARESYNVYFPEPKSSTACHERYLGHTFALPITDPLAIALKGIFANQKSVIDKVYAMVIGNAARNNENNINDARDKNLDIFKGLLNTSAGRQYGWMVGVVAGYSTGMFGAIAASAHQFAASTPWGDKLPLKAADVYLQKLPALLVGGQTLLSAMHTAEGGKPFLPVILKTESTLREVADMMQKRPQAYSQADRNNLRNKPRGSTVTMVQMVHIEAETGAIHNIPGEPPRAPGASPRSRAGMELARFEAQVKQMDLKHYDPRDVKTVQNYLKAEHMNLLPEAKIEQRLGVAVMVVQGLGLVWALRDLAKLLNQPLDGATLDASLSVADGTLGFMGGLADFMAASQKMRMLTMTEPAVLAEAGALMTKLKVSAAMCGVAGGIVNFIISYRKAEKVDKEGDKAAYLAHGAAAVAFGLNGGISTLIAADLLTAGAVTRGWAMLPSGPRS